MGKTESNRAAIGAIRARISKSKVHFFQHSRHDERRGIGRSDTQEHQVRKLLVGCRDVCARRVAALGDVHAEASEGERLGAGSERRRLAG